MIPIFDIKRQNEMIGSELRHAINTVITNGVYILGGKVAEFEEEFAKYIGVKYAVGVASGTDAISLSLLALGVGAGDGVIMPANSYPSVFAVTAIGAVPQLVDINPESYTIDPTKIERSLNKRTKVILPVHMYGQPADMEAILKISNKYGIPVIEDCAQAHGAEIKVKSEKLKVYKVGSMGVAGCFSFYPTKNLGCMGDGGMVVTNNKELAERVVLLRMYGEKGRYNSILLGRNSRLDEIQAAILLVKLKYLDGWNKKRRVIAQIYKTQISKIMSSRARRRGDPLIQQDTILHSDCNGIAASPDINRDPRNDIVLPYESEYAKHIYHLFVIRTKKRDQLKTYLESCRIMTGIHYPAPVHLVPSMKYLGYKKGDFPRSERTSLEVLSLPCFPELKEEEIKLISEKIRSFNN